MKNKMLNILKYSLFATFIFFANCSTQKNTKVTRTFHNTTSFYNIYFNGYESYKIGIKNINDKYAHDYEKILPVFLYSDAEQLKSGSAEMDIAIQKAAKAITNHSITTKPKLKSKVNMTERDKEFYSKSEFCKWIDDSYLLMGKANFHTKEYQKAIRAFRLIMTQFKKEETRFEAMLWLAKIYIEQEKFADAFDMLEELKNDVRHPKKLDKNIQLTYADLYIRQKNFEKAIPILFTAIKTSKNKTDKARYKYILAQIYEEQNDLTTAAIYYKQVIKMNPPYEMAFNAKIKRATAFNAGSKDAAEIKKQLKKMLKDEKNKEYKDQIYYALAKIEFKENNEDKAIEYFKSSVANSVANNTQKAISYLALADIYFAKPMYFLAGAYYDSTMQNLPKDFENYEEIYNSSIYLIDLVKHLTEIQNQDSLQRIAKMSEDDRNDFIDNIIKELTEKENAAKNALNPTFDPLDDNPTATGTKWYFYNPTAVAQGTAVFKKKWGNRTLEDDWRRSDKSISTSDADITDPDADSTIVTDNKTREYYTQYLPLNDSLMEISEELIINSLFAAAEIYYSKIKDYEQAIITYEELISRFPNNIYIIESYYILYKMYQSLNNTTKAEYYKIQIINNFPDSKYAKLLLNPNYLDELNLIENQANILYDTTLNLYKTKNYLQVIDNANNASQNYKDSKTLPKFMFLKAMSYGQLHNTDSLNIILTDFVTKYPKDQAVEMANEIIAMIKEGKFNIDIYEMSFAKPHYYVLALKNGVYDLKTINYKLTVESSKYSETKIFTLEEHKLNDAYSLIVVKSFENKEEAIDFYLNIKTKSPIADMSVENFEHFVISENNYTTFIADKILEKYVMYFKNKYL